MRRKILELLQEVYEEYKLNGLLTVSNKAVIKHEDVQRMFVRVFIECCMPIANAVYMIFCSNLMSLSPSDILY